MGKAINQILLQFGLDADCVVSEISTGLINNSYYVSDIKSGTKYVLQRINKDVFSKMEELMNNISLVNAHLRNSETYRTPKIFPASSGEYFFVDSEGETWRLFEFMEGSHTINSTSSTHIASEAGRIIGQFHSETNDFDTSSLSITIPDFHNLDHRLNQLDDALEITTKEEWSYQEVLMKLNLHRGKFAALVNDKIPVRVTHNDTKLNNILFDSDHKAICLIDLDTLMPGYLHTDYGDALRTLASSVSENEKDLSKVHFDYALFESFTEGYINETSSFLTLEDKEALPLSIAFMPFIMAIRFLTDYLLGNRYYKISYRDQNLDRTKNQLMLVQSIFSQMDEIFNFIHKTAK